MTQFLRYSPQNKTFEYVTNQTNGQSLIENRFTYLKRDSKRRLWLIGEKGVSVYIEQKTDYSTVIYCQKTLPYPIRVSTVYMKHTTAYSG